MSERAIERKHHVSRRTIIKALASADPPERKKIHREPAALDGLHDHIDAMITADPEIAIAAIWERLANEHGTTVAYPTLRTYVVSLWVPRNGVTAPDLVFGAVRGFTKFSIWLREHGRLGHCKYSCHHDWPT